jgi:metal-sulfur cluster biosynthetic enzyme
MSLWSRRQGAEQRPIERDSRPALVSEAAVLEALRPIVDPDFGKSIVELGFVKGIAIDGTRVAFTIELTTPACPVKAEFEKAARERARRSQAWTRCR